MAITSAFSFRSRCGSLLPSSRTPAPLHDLQRLDAQSHTDILMGLLLIALFYHTALGLQVVVEDYAHSGAKLAVAVRLACFALGVAGILATLRIASSSYMHKALLGFTASLGVFVCISKQQRNIALQCAALYQFHEQIIRTAVIIWLRSAWAD